MGAFLGGPVADRLGPRRASVAGDLVTAAAIGAIPLLETIGGLRFWHLLALAFVGGLFHAPGAAARLAMLPDLARRGDLSLERANSLHTGTEHVGYLLGAPLGGLLIAPLAPVILPVYAHRVFGDPAALGLMVATFGAGGIGGAVAFGLVSARAERRTVYVAAWLGYAAILAALVPVPPLWLLLPVLFSIGASAGVLAPLEHTVRQERTDPGLRARVFSTVMAAQMITTPIGVLGARLLLTALGLRPALAVVVAANAVLAVVAVGMRSARRLEAPAPTAAPTSPGGPPAPAPG